MAQVTGVGFSNFRVFSPSAFFEFAPITIFTGTNSSGKSSIFKGLRLTSDNAQDPCRLVFSGDSHKLGAFEKAVSFNSEAKEIELKLKVSQGKSVNIIDDYTFVGRYEKDETYSENGYLKESCLLSEEKVGNENVVVAGTEEQDGFIILFLNLEFLLHKVETEFIPHAKKVYEELAAPNGVVPLEFDYTLLNFINYDFSVVNKEKLKHLLPSCSDDLFTSICNTLNKNVITKYSYVTFNGRQTKKRNF